ncbi:MAG: hypothetical protein GWO20_16210, partial [Candidatus Korarchaeota archaeon]|nr:hypothetical protein [Candidatus Korarchaeota archaeon]NIU84956.1 hypothetical protein [Candidatus Thorarchaeota archaeon]
GERAYPRKILKYVIANTMGEITPNLARKMGITIPAGVTILPVPKPKRNPMTTQRISAVISSSLINCGIPEAVNMLRNVTIPIIMKAKFQGFDFLMI